MTRKVREAAAQAKSRAGNWTDWVCRLGGNMLGRHTRFIASIVSVCLCATLAWAQSPSITESGYPPFNSSTFDESDGSQAWRSDWQIRAQADAVYMTRNNSSRDIPVIAGPESFRMHDLNFDYTPGARLTIGLMNDDFELEGVFTTLSNWNASTSGTLTHGTDFDGPEAYSAASGAAQSTVDIGKNPNFITSSTFFAPINTAALTGAEADELEFLKAGAKFSESYSSSFQDFEVNYKNRAQPGRFVRVGLGYRNVQFGERGQAALSGTFDSVDNNGAEAAGNNGLADGSLTGAGLKLTSPAGTGTGFSETSVAGPDQLLFTTNLRTTNQLNGVQVTTDFLFLESDLFEIGGYAKGGVFHNFASGRVAEQYSDTLNDKSTYTRTLSDTKQTASFLGQAGVTGRFFLRQNVRLFASYEAMLLSGLALAPDQMRAITSNVTGASALNLNTQSSTFMHGGRVGLEILFW